MLFGTRDMTSEQMNTRQLLSSKIAGLIQRTVWIVSANALLLAIGCRPVQQIEVADSTSPQSAVGAHSKFDDSDLRSIILIPPHGDSPLDKQIARAQLKVRSSADPAAALEQLGWLFVSKARASFDPGFYKLAEQCAVTMNSAGSNSPESLLLRGHVLQSLHRFKEAEGLARELVAGRGRSFDYGLLGDVLMEQGNLTGAIEAYQKMADLKPDVHAYTRTAHVRWIKGDLNGAIEVMERAVTRVREMRRPRRGFIPAWAGIAGRPMNWRWPYATRRERWNFKRTIHPPCFCEVGYFSQPER
jgi:tetratricopeptide (TPR) repeat protein